MGIAETKTTLSEDGARIVLSCLDDARRLIAAGKVQRWEVLKWAVAVNLLLAGATTVNIASWRDARWLATTVLITATSWFLLYYYNRRVEGARETASRIQDYLDAVDAQAAQLCGRDVSKPVKRDREELLIFCVIVALSALPALVALFSA